MLELTDIVGQDAAVARLRSAVACGRMPHAYLFVGPVGVGRRTTALAMARMLLCERPNGKRACGECESCRLIDAGTHPDLHMVNKELSRYHDEPKVRQRKMQELSIDVIRSFLIGPAWRVATMGRGKVFIVLEADLMSAAAQGALLKTLEEPPPGVTIILIAQRFEQMLPTTQSRCTGVGFGPLPQQFVVEKLTAAGTAEAEAGFWARFTEGSAGEALKFAARSLYDVKRELIELLAAGEASVAQLGEFMAKAADDLARQIIKDAKSDDGVELSKLPATRRAGGAILRMLAAAFRDALHRAAGDDDEPINADQAPAIAAVAGRFEPRQLADIIEQLAAYETLLRRNVNPGTVWYNVAVTCASAAPLRL